MKDGKYFLPGRPDLVYDSIDFNAYYHSLITQRDGLYGVLGVVEPRYTELTSFEYYLAVAVRPDGQKVYLDIAGREYPVPDKPE